MRILNAAIMAFNEDGVKFTMDSVAGRIGISKKTNLGVETMAPLFKPLTDVGNVYFVKEYWDYYQSR